VDAALYHAKGVGRDAVEVAYAPVQLLRTAL